MLRQLLILLSYAPSTNPVTIFLYGLITLYGMFRLKKLNIFKGYLRFLLIPTSAAALLLIIIFVGEIIWWTIFTFCFHIGLALYQYQVGAFCWIIALSVLCLFSSNVFPKYVSFKNEKTLFGFYALTLYIAFYFMLHPTYVYINWREAIIYNASNTLLFTSFFLQALGKIIIAYIYRSVWK